MGSLNVHIDVRPFGTNSKWIRPSTFHQIHSITLGPNRFFLNDDFGKLTGTEQLFRSVRGLVIDPFFITCYNSDKSIIHWITDKLTGNIHSTLDLLTCQSWGTDLQLLYDFPSVLIWQCMVSFDAQSSSDNLQVLFCGFSSETLHILSISVNLVFQNVVNLQCWNF